MNIGFSVSEEINISVLPTENMAEILVKAIRQHSGWNYSCVQEEDGYLLKPTFRDMPYRNSFLPEIAVTVSQNEGETVLHLCARLVRFVRLFMGIWFAGLLLMEAFLVIIVAVSGMHSSFPALIPLGMCVLGYLSCKLGVMSTFRQIVRAIQKDFL